MIDFACTRCGHCCSNTTSVMADGNLYGLYLTPEEARRFPLEAIKPLFRTGKDITAYQLALKRCPNLKEDNECSIYGWRPLACRVFPIAGLGLVQADCNFVRRHSGETIGGLESEQAARDEQERQAGTLPAAEWKFPLNLERWVAV